MRIFEVKGDPVKIDNRTEQKIHCIVTDADVTISVTKRGLSLCTGWKRCPHHGVERCPEAVMHRRLLKLINRL